MTEWLRHRHSATLLFLLLAVFLLSASGFLWFSARVVPVFAEQMAMTAAATACGYIAIMCIAVLLNAARILWLTAREVRQDRHAKGRKQ